MTRKIKNNLYIPIIVVLACAIIGSFVGYISSRFITYHTYTIESVISVSQENSSVPMNYKDVLANKATIEEVIKSLGLKKVANVIIDNLTIEQLHNSSVQVLYKVDNKIEGIKFLRCYLEKCVEKIDKQEENNAIIVQYPKQIDEVVENPSAIKSVLLGAFGFSLLSLAYYLINGIKKHK